MSSLSQMERQFMTPGAPEMYDYHSLLVERVSSG